VEDFLFIYGDSDPSLKNDWKDWKKRLRENKPVPVFFQTDGDYVLHFGLSQLYKLPYNQSVHDLKPIDGYATGTGKNMSRPWDLARSMFGFSSSDSSLKGRIFFGHALCTEQSTHPEDVTLVLGQPKASYAPHYLKDAADFDYDQPDARLSGFKRYFTRNKAVLEPLGQQNDNQNVTTKFRPFGTGSSFECSIRFHNLRKVEIGALLSALTFHGNGDFVRHQVGGAKPYGFGKVRLEVVRCSGFGQDVDITEYQKAFEEELKSSYGGGGDWFMSHAVSAFFAMGSGEVNGIQELTYPTLKEHQKRESTLRQPGLKDRNRIKRYKK
jgi:CRISPR-associated protein (TIGR03986 family)